MIFRIAIVAPSDAQMLDIFGPLDVFKEASRASQGKLEIRVDVLSDDEGDVINESVGQAFHQLQSGGETQSQQGHAWSTPGLEAADAQDDLARMFTAVLRGWIQYCGAYYKSALYVAA